MLTINNMKEIKILLIIISCIVTTNIFGQDQIVTITYDTIECKINEEKGGNLYFSIYKDGRLIHSIVPEKRVLSYKVNAYDDEIEDDKGTYKGLETFTIDANIGYGYIFNPVEETGDAKLDSHNKAMKNGLVFNANIRKRFKSDFLIGLKYSLFHRESSFVGYLGNEIVTYETIGYSQSKDVTERLNIHYVGPSFSYSKIISSSEVIFESDISIGGLFYKDYLTAYAIPSYLNANAFAGSIALGIGVPMGSGVFLNIGSQLILSKINNYEYNIGGGSWLNKSFDEKEGGASRIEIFIGIKVL